MWPFVNSLVQIASAGLALGAAGFWWVSAAVKVPKDFPMSYSYISPENMIPLQNEGLRKLGPALYKQSLWSKWAAFLAGMSASFQAISFLISANIHI